MKLPASIGGWGELYYSCCDNVTMHGGFSIDDPRDSDVGFLKPTDLIGQVTLNQVGWVNVLYDVTCSLRLGFEVSHRRTDFLEPTFDKSGMLYHFLSPFTY